MSTVKQSDLPPEIIQQYSPYHYIPTQWVCALFVALFALSTIIHVGQAIRYRLWWLLCTAVFCGLGEIIGWAARLSSSIDVFQRLSFLIQISTTIMSPTFLVAANFIILGRIIRLLGPHYSRLSPIAYSVVFLIADTAALIVQAVGGAQASAALTLEKANAGARVMLGGILVQFVAIILYVALASEFLLRYMLDKPVRKNVPSSARVTLDSGVRMMIIGLCISTVFLFIRTIYRTVELQDGWTGKIITEEKLFNALDGMPIAVAMFTLNIFHPGRLVFNAERRDQSAGGIAKENSGDEQFERIELDRTLKGGQKNSSSTEV
ncbi:RTA1-domain-containing protein [Exidia glandulosa HHB12029]|uniref:RTA1-domain-containing protein n=1 Tax=Exidia glandulosa HHB12029 TaxID=1314781 RepID=A0A165HA06_EXIGL|nr:RTA1-domain-containing protein [Exidia glandulosa HHB12029]